MQNSASRWERSVSLSFPQHLDKFASPNNATGFALKHLLGPTVLAFLGIFNPLLLNSLFISSPLSFLFLFSNLLWLSKGIEPKDDTNFEYAHFISFKSEIETGNGVLSIWIYHLEWRSLCHKRHLINGLEEDQLRFICKDPLVIGLRWLLVDGWSINEEFSMIATCQNSARLWLIHYINLAN